ncbi:hypothetical protein F2Q68_00020152 [Brassica cretica]|uniref:Uncharacterized protein n=1 Tax=Brassica cretica TaxID=69181 RepID=A0A8S9G0V2_BRACR|nr:hypothetical protein F2Q68_00020152 [Brassica cretica]
MFQNSSSSHGKAQFTSSRTNTTLGFIKTCFRPADSLALLIDSTFQAKVKGSRQQNPRCGSSSSSMVPHKRLTDWSVHHLYFWASLTINFSQGLAL